MVLLDIWQRNLTFKETINAPVETSVTNKFSFGLTVCKILLCKFNRCSIHCSEGWGPVKNLGRELSFKTPYVFSKASVS